jgi:hypothetical protein
MKSFSCLDGEENKLTIKPGLPGCAAVSVKEPGADFGAMELAADDVPAAALALYRAAGLPEPLILPAAELDALAGNGTDAARTEVLWSNRPFPQAARHLPQALFDESEAAG